MPPSTANGGRSFAADDSAAKQHTIERMSVSTEFQLEADESAREWLALHPSEAPRVIAYDVHRCCGGGKICEVNVRELSRNDNPEAFASGVLDDGTRFLIDRRAA